MSIFRLHSKKIKDMPCKGGSFFEWATDRSRFFQDEDPWIRTQKFLAEIQKRLLAEQVFLVSRNNFDNQLKILKIAPAADEALLSTSLLNTIMCRQENGNGILFEGDLTDDPHLSGNLSSAHISSLISSVINAGNDSFECLFIVNYAVTTSQERIADFVHGLSTVLGQSVLNCRLSDALHEKNETLKEWAGQVEYRIQEGTKKLLEQEFQFHALFEGANDGILVHNSRGDLIEANGVICRLLGYERNELLQMNWKHIVPAVKFQELNSIFHSVLEKKQANPFEFQLRMHDASVSDVEISSRRVWFKGQSVIQSFVRDISLKKKLQQTALEAKERYKTLIESSLVGIFNVQHEKVLFVNRMFERIIGYSREELFSMNFYDLVVPEDRDRIMQMQYLDPGSSSDDEIHFVNSDGKVIVCELRATVITVEGSSVVLGNIIDVTRQKELARKLLEAKKMESIGTLAGGIAHDFNNLLGGILGYASLILSEMPEDNPLYADISTIADTTKRAAVLTERLLAFARGGKYQVTKISIQDLIRDAQMILENSLDKPVSIETHIDPELWKIKGDREQIHKALLNICTNGIEAMNEKGRLVIDTANVNLNSKFSRKVLGLPPGDYIRIVVQDDGYGMSESVSSRMFEPFYTTKAFGEGAGLGLAMVYGVVKNHEGAIQVDSAPGRGTSVSIFLPRWQPEAAPGEKKMTVKKDIHNRILLIDDEFIIREVGQRMLEKGGYEVITADNGAAGVKTFLEENNNIDLVLLDWMMPGMGGKETSQKLKEINPDVPVCFLSGYRPCDKPEMLQLSDKLFVQKPFQTDMLLATVDDIIKNRSAASH